MSKLDEKLLDQYLDTARTYQHCIRCDLNKHADELKPLLDQLYSLLSESQKVEEL